MRRSVKVLWRGWLIFFSRTGSFTDIGRKFLFRTFHRWLFSHKLSMCMTLDTLNEQACQNLYHPGCWGYSTSTFWFFSNLRFFLKYWSGSILYIGRLCLASDKKTLYICFHVPRRWFRNAEMQRDGWKSTINRLCVPSEKGNKHCFLSWVTSKE